MRFYKAKIILITSIILVGLVNPPASASTLGLITAADKTTGYNRALFKHWIDADKDGCNTRAEVLIDEAITKPKVGSKCVLTGGKWLSAYDGKSVTKYSDLDVDHMVPLAEAWRSGAWKWSAAQRQSYANDLEDSRALIAVTLSTNRSKGDKDPALWMPAKEQCVYIENWIAIKTKYSLTVDSQEAIKLNSLISTCITGVTTNSPTPTPIAIPTPIATSGMTLTPTPIASSNSLIVSPGAFCSPAGAIGNSRSGVTYTCKSSSTDSRNRWRQ
jgi:hypothetical protein